MLGKFKWRAKVPQHHNPHAFKLLYILALAALLLGASAPAAWGNGFTPGPTNETQAGRAQPAPAGPSAPAAEPAAPEAPLVVPQVDAVDDQYEIDAGARLVTLSVDGVLANDSTSSPGALTAMLVTPPMTGTLTFSTTGGFSYEAPPGYNGLVTFTYQAQYNATVGSATFVPSGQVFPSDAGNAVSLADLDGDGDVDAFVTFWVDSPGLSQVWLNNGAGTFSLNASYTTGVHSQGVALGDLDGDGDADAFVASGAGTQVWLNDRYGAFTKGQDVGNIFESEVALGDLDGDGDLDVFVVGPDASSNTVYLNNGYGTFVPNGQTLGQGSSKGIALGDFNGDGDLDAVIGNYAGENAAYVNEGGDEGGTPGSFSKAQALGSNSNGGAVGDLNGDGFPDIVFSTGAVWLNRGQAEPGEFTQGQGVGIGASDTIALGDLDDDGDLDIFSITSWYQSTLVNKVWLNDGSGVFTDGQAMGNNDGRGLALADLDGDGDLDAFVANGSQPNVVWLNQNATRAASDTATVRLLVGDVPGPVDITLADNEVLENQPDGATVGTFGSIDIVSSDHTYTLVSGPGSEDNAAFTIEGDQLKTAQVFDWESQNLYRIRVRTQQNDGDQLWFEKALIVQIENEEPEPEGPPARCAGGDITLFDTASAQATVTGVTVSENTAIGCKVTGDLDLWLPGNDRSGLAFQGYVDRWNRFYAVTIASFDLDVAGVALSASEVRLARYAGKEAVRLGAVELCAPDDWGGECIDGRHANLRIDASGLFAGSGNMPLPEFKVQGDLGLQVQSPNGPPAPTALKDTLKLNFLNADIEEEKDDDGKVIGLLFTGKAYLGLPKFVPNTRDCHLEVTIILYTSLDGTTQMWIETTPAEVAAPDGSVEFREGALALACDRGIPIGQTGLQISGIAGTLSLKPDAQFVGLQLDITNIDNFGLGLQLLTLNVGTKIYWEPWGIDIWGKGQLLEQFTIGEATASLREDKFTLTVYVQNLYIRGDLALYAWWPDGDFHFSGSGKVSLGLPAGAIVDRLFLKIPPVDATIGSVGVDFGEFTNGAYGVKGFVEFLSKQYGFYIDGSGDLDVGGVGEYQIATPPEILAARQRWQAAQAHAERDGLWLDAATWDDTYSFPNEHTAVIKATLSPSALFTQTQVITRSSDASFLVKADVPVTVSLRAPDGLVITPDNYDVPPVSLTHNVFYTVTDYLTYTQYWYDVRPAAIGDWQVIVDGDLDAANPMVGVFGYANIPTLNAVTLGDVSDPSQAQVDWSLTADVPVTLTVYANAGEITSTVTVTDAGGLTSTQAISNFSGVSVGEFSVASAAQLMGATDSGAVDLTGLESGDYALWVGMDDGIYPAVQAYALEAGSGQVTRVTVDNSASFPAAWSPAFTPTLQSADRQLHVAVDGLTHPDVDEYTVYIGQAAGSPDLSIWGLAAAARRNEAGEPLGTSLVSYAVDNVAPGETYYFSFEGWDNDSGQSVRTGEFSTTIPSGNYRLTTPKGGYAVVQGEQITVPISLEILDELFYPNVYLEIEEKESARGVTALFEDDAIGATNLSAEQDTVNVLISVDDYLPDGVYALSFVGHNGEMERRVNVSLYVPIVRVYLPVMFKQYLGPTPDLVVQDIVVIDDDVQVTIQNIGDGPVGANEEFWVDVYIDPHTIPTGVNQRWEDLADEGLRWGVTAPALPLDPGEAFTLSIGDAYYWSSFSQFSGVLTPGTPIYAQVDAHNIVTNYGAVYEQHEILGGVYNNITHIVYSGVVTTIKQMAVNDDRPLPSGHLPALP